MSAGVYVHVPWCRAICPYCGFAVVRDGPHTPWSAFVDRVLAERALRRPELPGRPTTVFLGGGTPSRMPASELRRLLHGLEPTRDAEITIEVNPEDATEAWLAAARDAGVTRVSVGIQSFEPAVARLLGRGHTSPQARAALARIRHLGFTSWSADLIFAVPGQTLAQLERDLDALLDEEPPHVALYGLTFEPGTPFEARRKAGKLVEPPEELWREMYDRIVDRLQGAGLERYEVSNFARPGHRSRHNTGYWTGAPYLGLGPAAHGLGVDGSRWINLADPAAWLTSDDPIAHRELPSAEQAAMDRLLTGLRHVEGIDLHRLVATTGHRPSRKAVDRLVDSGHLESTPPRIRLSHAGFPIADSVIASLVRALERAEPAPS